MSVPTQNTDPRQELEREMNTELRTALASLGLSETTTTELTSRITSATEASPVDCYKVIAGLKLLSEVIGVEEVPAAPDVIWLDVPASRKPLEIVQEPVQNIEQPTAVTEESAAQETSKDDETELNQNVKNMIRLLTHSNDDFGLSTSEARNKLDQVVEQYLASRKPYGNSIPELRKRMAAYLEGNDMKQVAELTGTTEGAFSQNIHQFIKTVHERVGGPDEMRKLLQGNEIAQEVKPPVAADETVEEVITEPEQVTEPEQEPLLSRLETLLKPVWGKAALDSLKSLFEDKLQDEDMLARTRIGDLLAKHAPRRGSDNELAVIEWDVLSYMSGYRIPSGNKLLRYSSLVKRFQNGCTQRNTDFESVVFDGFQKLIFLDTSQTTEHEAVIAAPKEIVAEPAIVVPEVPAKQEVAESIEVSKNDMYKLPRSFRDLIKDSTLTHEQQVQLALHFGFEFEGRRNELDPKLRDFAVTQMRERIQALLKTSNIRYLQGQASHRYLDTVQSSLLGALCPAANNGTVLRTYKELEPAVIRKNRMSAEQVRASFLAGLEKAAAIHAGRTEFAGKSQQRPRRR